MFEIIVGNADYSSPPRRVKEGGKDWLVCDAVILKEGVLHGNKGPLFYPNEEIGKNPAIWNYTPITNGHPKVGDQYVSVNHSDVPQSTRIGLLKGDRFEHGKRKVKAWIDVEAANAADARIVRYIEQRRPVGLSTGLITDNFPVNNGVHKGRGYTHVARNYRPDHLAVLVDVPGACSINDGCGFNVNADGTLAPGTVEELRTDFGIAFNAARRVRRLSHKANVSSAKACQILHDKAVKGHPLTDRQRRMFGAICGRKKTTSNEYSYNPVTGEIANCGGKGGTRGPCKGQKRGATGAKTTPTTPTTGATATKTVKAPKAAKAPKETMTQKADSVLSVKEGELRQQVTAKYQEARKHLEELWKYGGDAENPTAGLKSDRWGATAKGKIKDHAEAYDKALKEGSALVDQVQEVVRKRKKLNPKHESDSPYTQASMNEAASLAEQYDQVSKAFRDSYPSAYDPATGYLKKSRYIRDVYTDHVVFDEESDAGSKTFRVDYETKDGTPTFTSSPQEVRRVVRYEPVGNDSLTPKEPVMFKLTDNERKVITDDLSANVNTKVGQAWKGIDLKGLSDDALVAHHRHLKNNGGEVGQVNADGSRITYDKGTGQFMYVPPTSNSSATGTCGCPPTTTGAPVVELGAVVPNMGVQKPGSLTEALNLFGTPEEKAVWNAAVQTHNQQKQHLLNQILVNVADPTARQAAFDIYKEMTIPQLMAVASAMPKAKTEQPVGGMSLNYLGAAGYPSVAPPHPEVKPLRSPVYDFRPTRAG